MKENLAVQPIYEDECEDFRDAANDPQINSAEIVAIDALPTSKLRERKKAFLWLADPGNGSSKELRAKSQAMIDHIDMLLSDRGEMADTEVQTEDSVKKEAN